MPAFRSFVLYLLIACPVLAQPETAFRLEMDSSTHQYRTVTTSASSDRLRIAYDGITMQVIPNALKPHTAIDITLRFPESVDMGLLDSFLFNARYECAQSCAAYSVQAYASSKLLDRANRTVRYTMDGLKPGMRYRIFSVVFGLDGPPCGSDHSYTAFVTMPPEPQGLQKKLLMVINREWENETVLNEAIDHYARDAKRTMGVEVEKYYMGLSTEEKVNLYEYVQQQYFDNNLGYLFFIGKNAVVPTVIALLNPDKQVVSKSYANSFAWYTDVWNNSHVLDPSTNEFVSRRYQDLCYRAPEEIRNPIFQQSTPAISMGMILPDPGYSQQQMVQDVVAYFEKLRRYKNYEIEFDKKVLSSDGFSNESETVSRVITNGRWSAVDTVRFGRVKDLYYAGSDPVWKEDYLSKLQNNSYEIINYNGHGSPFYHSFGINSSDIAGLASLNTMILNFHSCEVGKFYAINYLAHQYLRKGNVLFIHAYSELLFEVSINNESVLGRDFRDNGPFFWMSQGYAVSDSFRYGNGYIFTDVFLGDPLLKLREVCGPVIESQASGDWHDQTTWTCGRIPTLSDAVRIQRDHTISLSRKGEVKEIAIEGKLDLTESGELTY
jgi:hypothetical protein